MPSPPESNVLRPSGLIGARDASATSEHPSALEQEVVELFDQLRTRLLRYVFGFGITPPDCEEVLQETFLALFQHLRAGKPRESLRAWLFRVAHNLALKKRLRSRRDSQNLTEAMLTAGETIADPTPNPEDQFSSRQARRRMVAVVEALPDVDRRCLMLRAEGLRYREIAAVLDMSLGAVSLSLGRSMARISRAIKR